MVVSVVLFLMFKGKLSSQSLFLSAMGFTPKDIGSDVSPEIIFGKFMFGIL